MPEDADVQTNFLQPIVGEYLSAVTFVMDYVQLDFSGARLTALTLPTVHVGGKVWTSVDSGWRDSLCERIGVTVQTALVRDEELGINFEDGACFSISLKLVDCRGPEAFNFSPLNKPTVVG
jgi:hypothetical protein